MIFEYFDFSPYLGIIQMRSLNEAHDKKKERNILRHGFYDIKYQSRHIAYNMNVRVLREERRKKKENVRFSRRKYFSSMRRW